MAASRSRDELIARRNAAIEMRRAGATPDQIAAKLKYASPEAARRDIDTVLSSVLRTPLDEMRALEALRLDALLITLWPEARRGVSRAIDQVIKIMERRAKLYGLDAPVQVEQITLDAVESEIKRLEAEMGQATRKKLRNSGGKKNAPDASASPDGGSD